MNVTRTIEMELNDGRVLTIDMSDALVNNIVNAFSLQRADDITDRHVKYYLASSMKIALGATNE